MRVLAQGIKCTLRMEHVVLLMEFANALVNGVIAAMSTELVARVLSSAERACVRWAIALRQEVCQSCFP